MDEIISDLTELIKKYQEQNKTGKVGIEINFFNGGISNYNTTEKQSKLLKNCCRKQNT